jgi:hypothetical protein
VRLRWAGGDVLAVERDRWVVGVDRPAGHRDRAVRPHAHTAGVVGAAAHVGGHGPVAPVERRVGSSGGRVARKREVLTGERRVVARIVLGGAPDENAPAGVDVHSHRVVVVMRAVDVGRRDSVAAAERGGVEHTR